ncbi:type III-A CRISPR-associated RAMP protein Csm5 [Desulfobacterales bacterium HSG2]|nr:type III-A CRISPR-associated RAMP protein Csm5 [Desulfobacterales bacterium HSG2]
MYISKIVELKTLSLMHIKGKAFDYGEGLLKGKDGNVYQIDNDKLCEYIDRKAKVDEYVKYFVRDEDQGYNDIQGFADFLNIRIRLEDFIASGHIRGPVAYVKKDGQGYRVNVREFKNYMRKQNPSLQFSFRRDDYDRYKNISLDYFLTRYNIFPSLEELRQMATGIIQIDEAGKRQTFIQSAKDRYFIPGSSLKGAIRNAVLWKVMSEPGKKRWLQDFVSDKLTRLEKGQLKNKNNRRTGKRDLAEKFSAQFSDARGKTLSDQSFIIDKREVQGPYSKRWRHTSGILRDVFRVVKVSDANFLRMELCNETARAVCVQGNQTYQKGFDIDLQCVSADSLARFKITIDLDMAETFFGEGNLPPYLQSVENLLSAVNAFFQSLWLEEDVFFRNKKPVTRDDHSKRQFKVDTQDIEKFYSRTRVNDGGYIFRTGWGGGLLTKTQFMNLEPEQRKGIRDLRMRRNEPAPKSRALVVGQNRAVMPLGWCHLRIVENAELPAQRPFKDEKKKISKTKKQSRTASESVSSDVMREALANLQKSHPEPASKSRYEKGDVIRNAPIIKAGETCEIKIKGQRQPAALIGKPSMYARVMNVTVVEIQDGIVVKVRKK